MHACMQCLISFPDLRKRLVMVYLLKVVRWFVSGVAVGLPVMVTFSETVGCVGRVDGKSMRPTLNPAGTTADIVWVDRRSIQNRQMQPGDIVALRSPTDPGSSMIKRIIATEGERIRTRSYTTRHVTVPPGHCWVEGDNPKTSRDSNLFGPVSLGLVYALATHIVWPPSRWRKLEYTLLPDQEECKKS